MNIDKAKAAAAVGNAFAFIKGEKITEGIQKVRDMAREKRDLARENQVLKTRAKLEDRVVKAAASGARVAVDAGFRRRDKKTRPNSESIRTGQYDSENWREAFDRVDELLEQKRLPNGKLPWGAIGKVLKDVWGTKKKLLKVTEKRFRRKYYTDRGSPR